MRFFAPRIPSKGGAATVQMSDLATFTHLVEDLLDEIRNGRVKVKEELVDLLLSAIDVIKGHLEARAAGESFSGDTAETRRRLQSFISADSEPAATEASMEEPVRTVSPSAESELSEYDLLELKDAAKPNEKIYAAAIFFNEENPMNTVGGIQLYAALKAVGSVLKTEPDFEELYEDLFHPQVTYYLATEEGPEELSKRVNIPDVVSSFSFRELETAQVRAGSREAPAAAATKSETVPPEEKIEPGVAAEASIKKQKKLGSVLRVDSARIDNLLNLVSEAVINKATFNQISTQFTETQAELQGLENLFREKMEGTF